MKSNKSKEMAHKIKLAKGWRNERRSRRRWRRTKTGCQQPVAGGTRKKKATRLIMQLSGCWWGRTQPWLLLWGGKRHLLAAAGSYGKEMWLVVVCRHCWCRKEKGCGSEGGRKKKRKKEEKGEGVTALPWALGFHGFYTHYYYYYYFFFIFLRDQLRNSPSWAHTF